MADSKTITPKESLLVRSWNWLTETQVWTSIFRHNAPISDRNRVLVVLSNVFLHLHPVRLRKSGVKLRYTWCMGGLSFFLFLSLTFTGLLLMFYYRPTLEYAYSDIVGLREHVPLGIMRELHRWGAHAMVITVWLHMFRVFMTGSYKPPREHAGADIASFLYGLPAAMGPAGNMGYHRWFKHGSCNTISGS